MIRKRSLKSLLIFSLLAISGAGVVWACSDYGYDDRSSFSPEYFVHKSYSPFFYDSYNRYYSTGDDGYITDNNRRFNDEVQKEWTAYLGKQLSAKQVGFLLFSAKAKQIDSLQRVVSKGLNGRGHTFFNYLPLLKDCETYSVEDNNYWYEKAPAKNIPANTEQRIMKALAGYKDPFIRERLWFQLVRYHFFQGSTGKKVPGSFYQYEKEFPKNLLYYRTLGYMAGTEYKQHQYARSNYHYSLGYNYTWTMRLPSQWSFHPQEEADWKETLRMAKSPEEKITLWHLLGIQYDPGRALQEIVALNPSSEKMDLLLSRLINIHENWEAENGTDKNDKTLPTDLNIVETIAGRNDIAKPWFWHLAAGYLQFLNKNNKAAITWYTKAKAEIPKTDMMVLAQYRLLSILLDIRGLKKLDVQTENRLIPQLNWLADLKENKKQVIHLRFNDALAQVTSTIGRIYLSQHDLIKANCFATVPSFYADSTLMDSLQKLMVKKTKLPFERVMLRYYPVSLSELYYQQATLTIYKENIAASIRYMTLADSMNSAVLPANPFTSRLNDCHDCEFGESKTKYTPLSFLKKIQSLQSELQSGKNKYQNAILLGGAYYNITHYGNSRLFYQTSLTGGSTYQPNLYAEEFREMFTSPKISEKYYRIALANATTAEQKARCTFLLSKCERNVHYNQKMKIDSNNYSPEEDLAPAGNYFAELKQKFSNTAYYREVIKECGYFSKYVKGQ